MVRVSRWTGAWLAAAALVSCSPSGGPAGRPDAPAVASATPSPLACQADQITAEALRRAGPTGDGSALLANGRAVTPAGMLVGLGRFPLGLAVNADETRAYVTHNGDGSNALLAIDLAAGTVLQRVALPSSFKGVALSPDGRTLWVGGGASGKVFARSVGDDGTTAAAGEVLLTGYVSDLAASPDGTRVYAAANGSSVVSVIDTATLAVTGTLKAGTFPYDLLLSPDGKVLWTSNMASSTVVALDTATGARLASIAVPKLPEAMALSPDGKTLFVACSDADTVAAVDVAAGKVAYTLDLTGDPAFARHGNVNGLALSADGARLYAAEAGMNRVYVVDVATRKVLGSIPTGWYPTEVLAGARGLYVLSSKGLGSQAKLKDIPGLLSVVPWPDDATLAAMSAQVEANNRRAETFFTGACAPDKVPVLSGKDSPIRHVVLIVRENKTYDMLLGDFEGGDGDPALVVFGADVTPNLHKLAGEFVNLDNYYANAENSTQGHLWTTTAHCGDFIEKMWIDQMPVAGYEPATLPEDGTAQTIFDNCFGHGVGFRNYGEMPAFAPYMFGKYFDEFDNKYPFWNQAVKDVDKASEFIRELELGIFEPLTYIVLPNDHTYGSKGGKPAPRSMVADNDRATAMIVEALSRSVHWPETAVFLIEDDPQGSGDHVESHRSICVVISPWVRRGYNSSVHYDIPSLYRTIEAILGLPPMGRNDALAPPMADIWVDGEAEKPDYAPYEGVPVDVPDEVNPKGNALEALTAHCDFDEVDACPGLGRALWKSVHGDREPPPYARFIDD